MKFSNSHILVKGTITVANTASQYQPNNAANKKMIFKNCVPFTNCTSRISSTLVDHAHDIDIVIPMCDLNGI